MLDKQWEQLSTLKLELIKLDNAYVVGNYVQTLNNLNINTDSLDEGQLLERYTKVAKRIFEIQSYLNQDNCQ